MSADPSTTAAPASSARLAVDVRRFPWIRPLAGDYAFNFDKIASLYAGDPQSPAAWRDAIARVQSQGRDRRELGEQLAAQQARRAAPAESVAAAARLTDPRTAAIVTGQQAGAFGGPLFTLLKAVTALQLARRVEATTGTPTVAVFWVDAEDHDWDEIASATVLDAQFVPRTITLAPPEGAGERPIATLTLDERVDASIAELEAVLARTEFTDALIARIRAAYRPGIGVADAFARLLESLLGRHGLIVFDSADAATKPLSAAVFGRELAFPGTTSALATRAANALSECGHTPQVTPHPDSVALFRIDGARRPIKVQGDGYAVGEDAVARSALQQEAAQHPERFSPNVLLRPIVQDTLFPTICYVAGPSELAYLGQLAGVYDHFGVPMPLIHPRASATLADSATARFLSKYDVPLEDLQPQDESVLNRLLASLLPPSVEASLKDAEESIRTSMQRVVEAMPAVDPTLVGAAKTTLGKFEHELRALQGKLISAAKKRDETLRRQFTRAQAQTFPQGHPQERTLAAAYFLNLYGDALIDRLLEELPLDLGQHWVLTI